MKTILMSLIILTITGSTKAQFNSNYLNALHNIYIVTYIADYDQTKLDESTEKPTLEIYTTNQRFIGFSGCNQIQGAIKIVDDSISFNASPTISTLMACDWDTMEQAFNKALSEVETFELNEDELSLMHKQTVVLKLIKKTID